MHKKHVSIYEKMNTREMFIYKFVRNLRMHKKHVPIYEKMNTREEFIYKFVRNLRMHKKHVPIYDKIILVIMAYDMRANEI